MKESDVDELLNKNYRYCTLLGIATALICCNNIKSGINAEWWKKAIDEVIYRNNPIPDFPK